MTRVLLERPEATTRSLDDLLAAVRRGEIRIPQFQRNFRWRADDVLKLFDSIYRGYPIGNLLFWSTKSTVGSTTMFGPVEIREAPSSALLVLDGQQRLVSLVGTLLGPGDESRENDKFRVYFDPEHRVFKNYRATGGVPAGGLPLHEIADTVRYLDWLRRLPSDAAPIEATDEVVRALRDYRIPVYIVHSAGEAQVREIFERLNTGGQSLQAADVFNALRGRSREEPFGNLSALKDQLANLGFGALDERWLLKITGAILGLDVTRKLASALSGRSQEDVDGALRRTYAAVERIVDFLRMDVGIAHLELLPYRFPLVPLAKFFDLVPAPSIRSRARLRAWLWRSAVSEEHRRSDAITIRSTLQFVSRDEDGTSQALLENASRPRLDGQRLGRHDFRSARAKIVANALIALCPRDLSDGRVLDAVQLVDVHGENAFPRVLQPHARGRGGARGDTSPFKSAANRLVHPPARPTWLFEKLRSWAESAEPSLFDNEADRANAVLESHAIDETARGALVSGDQPRFLAARMHYIEQRTQEYLRDRCTASPEDESSDDSDR